MCLDPAGQDAAVILSCLHHDGKVSELIRTVIDVETVDVVFQDCFCSFTFAVTNRGIDLFQHVDHVDKDMPTAHTGIYQDVIFDTKPLCTISPETA